MSRFGDHEAADSPDDEQLTETWSYDGELDLQPESYDEPAAENLEYISKSRIKTFLKCERKFGYKYFAEVREDENFYMKRGSDVHEAFELFHDNLTAFIAANDEAPESLTELMGPSEDWFQFLEWIGPFFDWELQRLRRAREATESESEALSVWTPHSVEKELWVEEPPVGQLPWMGPYDVLIDAQTVPALDADDGWVVVDYKTGKWPRTQYRDTGIHIDLEFYAWMLEQNGYDVAAGIGLYPKANDWLIREMPNPDTREDIAEVVRTLHTNDITASEFPINPSPLCDYCFYQDQCPSQWGS